MTAPEADLAGKKNGALLSLAESAGLGILLTLNKDIQFSRIWRAVEPHSGPVAAR
jgi:hypothetical protein